MDETIKYQPKVGQSIKDVLSDVLKLLNNNDDIVEFVFNGIKFRINNSTDIEQIIKDYHFSKEHNKKYAELGPMTVAQYEEVLAKHAEKLHQEQIEKWRKYEELHHPVKTFLEAKSDDKCYRLRKDKNIFVAKNQRAFNKCCYDVLDACVEEESYQTKKQIREYIGKRKMYPKSYPCLFIIEKVTDWGDFNIEYFSFSKLKHFISIYCE